VFLGWLDHGTRTGAENMERDRALLRCAEDGRLETPVLVVYRWRPAAISLGFHQPGHDLDVDLARRAGIDVVRRPTGGAAVLHDEEITYALAGPLGLPGLGGTVTTIYDGVAEALVRALADRGIDAARGGGGRPTGFACFAAAGGHEITVRGRKLVGSALRKGRRAFLQHGSLLTGRGHLELVRFARESAGESASLEARRSALAAKTIDLSELGVGDPDLGVRFALALAVALAERMNLPAEPMDALPPCVTEEMETARVRDAGRSDDAVQLD
jgi:lipoate-protein ligase A